MSYNTFPQNPFPSNSEILPTFTSNDRAFLEDLPEYPSEDGAKVLTATTSDGKTNLTYEDKSDSFDYSTTEQDTGQKWIDGKELYCKVIEFGTLPNNSSKSVSSGLSNVSIIKMDTITYGSDSNVTLPYVSSATNNKIEISYNNNNTISIVDNEDFSAHSAYIILYYTKNII